MCWQRSALVSDKQCDWLLFVPFTPNDPATFFRFRFLAAAYLTAPSPDSSKDLVGYVGPSPAFSHPPTFTNPSRADPFSQDQHDPKCEIIEDILAHNDLYHVLGVTPSVADDLPALRRAYLSRSRRCHPE